MAVNLGSTAIADAKLGTTQVEKIYLGNEQVWSKSGGGWHFIVEESDPAGIAMSIDDDFIFDWFLSQNPNTHRVTFEYAGSDWWIAYSDSGYTGEGDDESMMMQFGVGINWAPATPRISAKVILTDS